MMAQPLMLFRWAERELLKKLPMSFYSCQATRRRICKGRLHLLMAAIQSPDVGLAALVGNSKILERSFILYWVSFSFYLVEFQNA